MNRGTILFRVDGSTQHGMGRVARCLALANALQRRRYQMSFVSQLEGNGWADRIRRFRHAVTRVQHPAGTDQDRDSFLREIAARAPTIVIVDAEQPDEDYLAELVARAPLVISMDEASGRRFPSDLLLNPTLGRQTGDFELGARTQLLAGARFAMIRAEFRRCRNVRATEPSGPTRVLVALGGGANATASHVVAKG
ncbi:MAG TPA: hypothetical protein VNC50_15650, partial [Planctomycetia bacterium]|nr:hypothetical protein [Planctomycetia bacterium]